MTKPNDLKTMKKSILTRRSRRLIAEMGCPVVTQPKLSLGTKSIAKNTMRKVQNGHKHANFHHKEKAKAHCKGVQDQDTLQLVMKNGRKVQSCFSKQKVVIYTKHNPGPEFHPTA